MPPSVAAPLPAIPVGNHICVKPLDWFLPDPNQPRKYFDNAELLLLGASLKVRQLQPVLARPAGIIIDGERRVRAVHLVGLPTLSTIITEESLRETQVRIIQLTANMQRADLSGFEKSQTAAELLSMNPSWQAKDLAAHLCCDPSMVTRLLSPSKCIKAVQDALRDGKLGITDTYAISKLSESDQVGLLALKLSGASREAIEAAGRKTRSAGSATPAVKVAKIKCNLPGNITVQISGEGVSLEDSVEALGKTMAAMKKAIQDGFTAKTFAAAMKDRAKKGE